MCKASPFVTTLTLPWMGLPPHSAESDISVATPVIDHLAGHHHSSDHHSCGKVFQVDVLSACAEHMPLSSAGGTMNVSVGETLLQTRVLTFLNQHGSGQSMHYIADTQEQPSHRCDICKWGGVEVERVCLSELHWYSLARSTSCHVTQIIPRPFLKPHWESSSCGLMMVWRHSSRMRERTFLGILSNVMPP